MEVDEDRKVIRVESGSRLPQGREGQVGTAKSEVRGGRVSPDGKAGGGVCIKKAK